MLAGKDHVSIISTAAYTTHRFTSRHAQSDLIGVPSTDLKRSLLQDGGNEDTLGCVHATRPDTSL